MSLTYPFLAFHPDRTDRAWQQLVATLPRTKAALDEATTAWIASIHQRLRRVAGGESRPTWSGQTDEMLAAALRWAALQAAPAEWPTDVLCDTLQAVLDQEGGLTLDAVTRCTAQWPADARRRFVDEALPPILWEPPLMEAFKRARPGKAQERLFDRIQTQHAALHRLTRDAGGRGRGQEMGAVSLREAVAAVIAQLDPAARAALVAARVGTTAPGTGWWEAPTPPAPEEENLPPRRGWGETRPESPAETPHARVVTIFTLLLDPSDARRAAVLRSAAGETFELRRLVLGLGDLSPEIDAVIQDTIIPAHSGGVSDLEMWISLLTARAMNKAAPDEGGAPEAAPDLRALDTVLTQELAKAPSPRALPWGREAHEQDRWRHLVATPGLARLLRHLDAPTDPRAAADLAAWQACATRWQQQGGLPLLRADTMAFDLQTADELAAWLRLTGGWEAVARLDDTAVQRRVLLTALDLELLSWTAAPPAEVEPILRRAVVDHPTLMLDLFGREVADQRRSAQRGDGDAEGPEARMHQRWLAPFLQHADNGVRERAIRLLGQVAPERSGAEGAPPSPRRSGRGR